ncbi:MAG: flagellar motor switch protein FliM [Armatimonadetes bacterium]|nr:flagellar motor switch protein FliM [Armatimonadota bacterium]
MSDILSQDEIESLLSSLNDGGSDDGGSASPATEAASASQKPAKKGARSAVAYEVYDFRRPDKFSKEQLRTLQMLHETFGRLAATTLSATLRCNVAIDLISLEQVPYEEYLRSISQSVFTVFSIPPLSGQAVMEMEFGLVYSMMDKLLGGPGKAIDRNLLTDIESHLFQQVAGKMFSALKSAWEGVVIVNPSIEDIETSAQFVQIAPPSDIVVSILFEVRVGDAHGAMSLCVPYMVLKPITAKLSAQKWFAATSSRKQTSTHRKAIVGQLQGTNVEVAVQMGRSRISVQDFLSLQRGDVIRLDQKTKNDMKLLVSDKEKFLGRPSLNGKKIAFHITNHIEEA